MRTMPWVHLISFSQVGSPTSIRHHQINSHIQFLVIFLILPDPSVDPDMSRHHSGARNSSNIVIRALCSEFQLYSIFLDELLEKKLIFLYFSSHFWFSSSCGSVCNKGEYECTPYTLVLTFWHYICRMKSLRTLAIWKPRKCRYRRRTRSWKHELLLLP